MKLFPPTILLLLVVFLPSITQACWPLKERKEIDGFSELDDVLILSFKDAINCKPINDAKVFIDELEYKTNSQGYLKLPMASFFDQMDARTSVRVEKQDYISLSTELIIEAGTVLNRKMVLSPALPPGKVRFVLQWNSEPEDLDLHLKGPEFHISYRHMKSAANKAKLDRDEMYGYGPETITLDRINQSAAYSLWVDNYSDDGDFQGAEEVVIYSGSKMIRKIPLISTSKQAIKVLEINQGEFKFVNKPSPRP